jgi:hypothetical protein
MVDLIKVWIGRNQEKAPITVGDTGRSFPGAGLMSTANPSGSNFRPKLKMRGGPSVRPV